MNNFNTRMKRRLHPPPAHKGFSSLSFRALTRNSAVFMKSAHRLLSYVVIFMGVVHIMLTTKFFNALTFSALWFISGGLVGIFLGFINIIMNHNHIVHSGIWAISNVLGVLFSVLALWIMEEPKYGMIAIIILLTALSSFYLNYSRR